MARRQLRSNQNWQFEEPAINLTPLIDVVFVILIMFIVIAPLLELDRIELAESLSEQKGNAIAAQENSPIAIHVFADNSIQFNHQKVTIPQIAQLLKEAKTRHPGARPQLYHDRHAQFGTYQEIKNATEAAGFQQMDIILKPG